MNADQVNVYIGMDYEAGSFGPTTFNCWGLLHHIQNTYFGVNLPIAPIGDAVACLDLFESGVHGGLWSKLEQPEHGAGALLRGGNSPHVGIYLDIDGGGILHALENVGVIFTPVWQLRKMQFGRTTYYRFNK